MASTMKHFNFPLLAFCSFLMALEIQGSTRDRLQGSNMVNDCIKKAIPSQIFNQCCLQERNCSVIRQRDQGYECIVRLILDNITSSEEDWRSLNSEYTSSSSEDKRDGLSHDILRAVDNCQALERQDQQRICLRGEMIKMCENNTGRYQPTRTGFSRSPYDDSRTSSPRSFGVTRWMQTTRNPLNRFGQRGQRTDYYGGRNTGSGVYYPSNLDGGPYNSHVTYGYQDYARDGRTSFSYPSPGRVEPGSFDNWGSWNSDETSQGQMPGYDSRDYEQRRT